MLPDRELWDVRHYGETRIAIRLLSAQTLGSAVDDAETEDLEASHRRMEDGDV